MLTHGNNKVSVSQNSDLNIISWKTNHVTFQETGLNEVFDLLSAAYKKQIVWNDSDITNCYLSAEYNDLPIEDVMTSICTVFGLSYTQEKETYKISGRGCQ